MRTVAIIQARMGSTRLPGKVMADIAGSPAIWHIVRRCEACKSLDSVCVATTVDAGDDAIEVFCRQQNVSVFRGSVTDVLSRFAVCAAELRAQTVVRLTADNLLIDPLIIDEAVALFYTGDAEYIRYHNRLPVGMSIEVFTADALLRADRETNDPVCREHVTPYLYNNPDKFRSVIYDGMGEDRSHMRWTMDEQEDCELIRKIYDELYPANPLFGYESIIEAYGRNPDWYTINSGIHQKRLGE